MLKSSKLKNIKALPWMNKNVLGKTNVSNEVSIKTEKGKTSSTNCATNETIKTKNLFYVFYILYCVSFVKS